MFENFKKLYNANLELSKHRKAINKYNKEWEKIKKEQNTKEVENERFSLERHI